MGLQRQRVLLLALDRVESPDVLGRFQHPAGHWVALAASGDSSACEAVVHRHGLAVGAQIDSWGADGCHDLSAYHDAIMAALERCTPLRFTSGLGGALAGRPIAIRYVDDRNAE